LPRGHRPNQLVESIKDAVCYNQGELAQYSYLAAEKHKKMKDEIRKNSYDPVKLKNYKKDLETHLNAEFIGRIIHENFKLIHKYFGGRAKIDPRVCIKAIDNNTVIDFRREEDQFYVIDCNLDENTGFFEVYKTGNYYFSNDLPTEVKSGRYFNPRLDKHEAVTYKSPTLNWLSQKRGKEDMRWVKCWRKISLGINETTPKAKQCYKSTLITPMTLMRNSLSAEYKEMFRIPVASAKEDRAIYGFLCFDHHYTGYFKPEIDIPLSYIFADLLSLYLITNLTYTEYSKTFKEVERSLNKQSLAII
jgi:hypothetical protein